MFIKLWRLTLGTILAHYNCLYFFRGCLLEAVLRVCVWGGEPVPSVDHFDLADLGPWQVAAHTVSSTLI